MDARRRWAIAAALFGLYIIWGSTYLAIKWGVAGFPPFFMAGVRAVIAGLILYIFARWRGGGRPTGAQWRSAAIIGGLLLGSNGLVSLASQWLPSSVCSLMLCALPVWMVLLDRTGPRGSPVVWLGVALGLLGVAILVSPKLSAAFRAGTSHAAVLEAAGMGALIVSSLAWANGSLYSRRADKPRSALAATGMQLICGGLLLLVVSALVGEPARLSLAAMTMRPVLSLVYLILFGSVVGYTSYIWLLEVTTPAVVSTYAFANPIVAVILGASLGGERLGPRVLVAAAVIVAGVVAIVSGGRKKRAQETGRRREEEMEECERGVAGAVMRR